MAGWSETDGMQSTVISWQELKAYNDCHHNVLSPEELDIMKNMSRAYVSEIHDKNPHKSSPYGNKTVIKNSFAQAMKNIAVVKELKQ